MLISRMDIWKFGVDEVQESYIPFAMNRGASSRYAIEMKDHRETKIRKLICEGEAVRVSLLYQWATVILVSTVLTFWLGSKRQDPRCFIL